MAKLTQKRISWLVRQISTGKRRIEDVADLYKVTERRIQQIMKEYRDTGRAPQLESRRRPSKNLTTGQKSLIEDAYQRHRAGARLLKLALDEEFPRNGISKNKIHEYLVNKGLTRPNKRKQQPRKRCRYERAHSGSLVHIDTHYCDWDSARLLITVIDDASRRILAACEVTEATASNAIMVMQQAIEEAARYCLHISQVNSDRGPEFFANTPGKKHKEHAFLAFLRSEGIHHVPSRVKNPQTNGKLERWHQEYEKHRPRFNSLEEYIYWNNRRIHGELGTKPERAFVQKLPAGPLLGVFFRGGMHA